MPIVRRVPDSLMIVAQVGFSGVGAWLTHIDIREHRLPNRILAPTTACLLLLCGASTAFGGSAEALVRAIAGAAILGSAYLALWAGSRGGLGGGDVKLAVPIGILLAWDGWLALVAGSALAFVVGGAWAIGVLATGRGTRDSRIPFGPCMVLGCLLGLCLT